MNWYYALGGQQQGPVDDAQLDALIAAGTLTPDTLVWRDGMTNWQPLRVVRPAAASPGAPPVIGLPPVVGGVTGTLSGDIVCAECGKTFSRENAIQYGTSWVCAECKPVFLQKLREGASTGGEGYSLAGEVLTEDQLLAGEYRIDLSESLERAWRLFTRNAGPIIATTLVVGVVAVACWAVTTVAGLVIPMANSVLSLFFTGPLVGGYLWFLLKLARGQEATMGDAFAGFTHRYVQLMLSSLVQGLVGLVCMLPFGFVIGWAAFTGIRGGGPPQFNAGMGIGLVLTLVFAVAALTYVTTLWTHSILLVMDKGYKFWPAMQLSRRMVNKRWWMTWLFILVAGIIGGMGAIACGVGLVVSMPLYFAMKVFFYEDNFRNLARAS